MQRRNYIRAVISAVSAGAIGLSGCLGNNKQAPPRRSEVIDSTDFSGGQLVVQLEENMSVTTRKKLTTSEEETSSTSLSPIGVAQAKGRGATGRTTGGFSSAPKTGNGWAIWGGGAYVAGWYSNNEDDVREVSVSPDLAGIKYFGSNEAFEEQSPGPGSVNWDEVKTSISEGEEVTFDEVSQVGWYRVGFNLDVDEPGLESRDMGFDSLDFRVERNDGNLEITETWVVKPRI